MVRGYLTICNFNLIHIITLSYDKLFPNRIAQISFKNYYLNYIFLKNISSCSTNYFNAIDLKQGIRSSYRYLTVISAFVCFIKSNINGNWCEKAIFFCVEVLKLTVS